ncbi:MAG: hypothetical protein GY724_10825 [Actinomycetia bacterium]|nr:hypothetical protein [Actinomycetes bacterium]
MTVTPPGEAIEEDREMETKQLHAHESPAQLGSPTAWHSMRDVGRQCNGLDQMAAHGQVQSM